jgi:hypothetical protein
VGRSSEPAAPSSGSVSTSAAYLLELRGALEAARDTTEREQARLAFAELVPPEFSGH